MSGEDTRLHEILDELIDRWCERRALRPLALLLPAWPAALVSAEQWHTLSRALQALTGLDAEALTPAEQALHAEARRLVNGAMRAIGQGPP